MRRRRGIKGDFSKKIGVLCLALLFGMGSLTVGYAAWIDTLTIDGTVSIGSWELGGTPGFWKNSDSHNTYTEKEIEGWLGDINDDSDDDSDDDSEGWLNDIITIDDMEAVFTPLEGGTAYQKFLRHYLATRLNVAAGRLFPGTTHSFGTYDPGDYLKLGGQDTLLAIIDAIESRHPDPGADPPIVPPTEAQFEIMKDICDALNNLLI